MSRNKKSRKPGLGSSGPVKDDKKKVVAPPARKAKVKKGKVAGNRQQEAKPEKQTNQQSSTKKDPRIGSKTPIVLVKESITKVATAKKKQKSAPIAAIRTIETDDTLAIENNDALEQELYAIEADARLQEILAKQEDDIELTEAEVTLFNELMERHEEIRVKLGWNDEDEEETNQAPKNADSSEDELWDKLDSGDLSDYQ